MRILGIDPGSLRTGYGVIDLVPRGVSPVDYGCITSSSKMTLPQRYCKIFDSLKIIIEKLHPDCLAIESLFYCKNIKTAFKLGEARAVAILAAGQSGLPFYEYAPRLVKQAVVGVGSAHKSQVKKMVRALLNIRDQEISEDVTDALAVAICHGNHSRLRT